MVEDRRIYFDVHVESNPVKKFKGSKIYVSTGDSDNMENGERVSYAVRPSRANVEPNLNDIIFAKMANTDKTFLINNELSEYIFSTGFFDISSERIHPKFLYYLIKSHCFDSYKNAFSEGTTQVSLSNDRFKKIKMPFESDINRQIKIANYLDEKINIIDKEIVNLKKEIEELNSLKFSIIDECIYEYGNNFTQVNRAWITQIPQGWELKKFKLIFRVNKGLDITKENLIDGGNSTISYGQTHNDFYKYEFNPTDQPLKGVDDSYLKVTSAYIEKGDFVFVDTSEDIKGCTDFSMLNNDDFCFAGYHSLLAKPYVKIYNRFFMYLFMSSRWGDQIKSRVNGVKVYSITQSILNSVDLLVPPYDVQKKISDEIDKKLSAIPELIDIKNRKINEFNNLKISLINENITGLKGD